MTLSLRPVRVATGHEEEGNLVFDDQGRLVAVLVHLSDKNEIAPGQWFLEVGFGSLDSSSPPTFAALNTAKAGWINASPEQDERPHSASGDALPHSASLFHPQPPRTLF